MIVDSHVHTFGHEKPDAILRAMDRAGIDRACVLSPPSLADAGRQRKALAFLSALTAHDPDRLLGYFWLNPLLHEAADLVVEARDASGVRAIKLMSDHWYPHDEPVVAVLGEIERAGLPVLFHAGILWSHMDSSRYCRPTEFEIMLHMPRLRFTLAHMAWPWVEECFAVVQRMRDGIAKLTRGPNTMHVDLSPGTPDAVRDDAFRIALALGEVDRLFFGSDDSEPQSLEKAARVLAGDRERLDRLGASESVVRGILGENVLRFLGIAP